MEECIFDLSKVYEGQILKNYKELCTLIGVKPKTGKSKMYQMKEIERYLVLKSAGGNKFLIITWPSTFTASSGKARPFLTYQ